MKRLMAWTAACAALALSLGGCDTEKTQKICDMANKALNRIAAAQDGCTAAPSTDELIPDAACLALEACTSADKDKILSALTCIEKLGDCSGTSWIEWLDDSNKCMEKAEDLDETCPFLSTMGGP